jgi:hypothetical protein
VLGRTWHADRAQRRRQDREDVGDREYQREGEEDEAREEQAAGCTSLVHGILSPGRDLENSLWNGEL